MTDRIRIDDFDLSRFQLGPDDMVPMSRVGAVQGTYTVKGQPMPSSWRLMDVHDPELQAALEASARGDVVPFPDRNLYRVVNQEGPRAWTVDPIVIGPDELVFRVDEDEVAPSWEVGSVGTTRVNGREVQTVVTEVLGGGWFKLRAVGPETPGEEVEK